MCSELACKKQPISSPFAILIPQHDLNDPFPRAEHSQTAHNPLSVNSNEIIVPNYNFLKEVHNENFHYTRLIAGFVQEENSMRLPISTHDPNLEPLLFLDIFINRKEHFHDLSNLHDSNNKNCLETYGKYIKLKLMNIDLR
ncbi:38479_t:CDS:1 [Gigaspora margarita]|uniref:38479_t:CDS:1 n=1 Tax=Gigaspora margarita TaxID=4874 RepID=A0ABN7VGC4_GIGMA|nr:38479_t:CDS:1 [Gigaspora margarita]